MSSCVDSKETIENLLKETKNFISSNSFDINQNFYMKVIRRNDDQSHPKNQETMLALSYDAKDVLEEIKTLTVGHYYHTLSDNMLGKSPFYVFIKVIQTKQVYIKYKIKPLRNKLIFCVSFHFTEYEINLANLPYSNK